MKDIKELIYAAVEENAVAFQELAGSILQARAYDAIEAMRPEVGASMFGEAKECSDEEDEDGKKSRKSKESDEDDSMEDVEEALVGKQHKIDKNKNGKIDAHDFKLLRKEEVEELDEISVHTKLKYLDAAEKSRKELNKKWDQGKASQKEKESVISREDGQERAEKSIKKKTGKYSNQLSKFDKLRYKITKEEVEQIDEVDHPKNQADMLAHIMHQIKTTGHPVATDAQFRASHGKDESKIASLEPPKDKMQYAIAQGGNVKP